MDRRCDTVDRASTSQIPNHIMLCPWRCTVGVPLPGAVLPTLNPIIITASFSKGRQNLDLRCVLLPTKTRLESSIKNLILILFFIAVQAN